MTNDSSIVISVLNLKRNTDSIILEWAITISKTHQTQAPYEQMALAHKALCIIQISEGPTVVLKLKRNICIVGQND